MTSATRLIVFTLLLSPVSFTQAQGNKDLDSQLETFLQRFPKSDLNKDGQLTREEVRQFNRTRQRLNDNRGRRKQPLPEPTAADVAYGTHEKQRFDLWAVPGATEPTPLVIFIHGGGFRGGDKKAVKPSEIADYHENGIAFASMNYRLSDVGPYPIMMEDCARGLQTIRHRAKDWNIDSDAIGCYGGSAGAGISLWLAFHDDLAEPDSEEPVARQSTRISAAATSGGQSTYDLRTFREWFSVPDLPPHQALIPFYDVRKDEDWTSERVIALMEAASPITHLTDDDNAPVYMTYNRGDVPVTKDTNQGIWVHHCRLGLRLQDAMKAMGKECHVSYQDQPENGVTYPGITAFFIAKLKND